MRAARRAGRESARRRFADGYRSRPSESGTDPLTGRARECVSTFVLLTITGLGLGAMYFLIASGLSLIYGLMGVLNFAHGAFLTVGAYASWWLADQLGGARSWSAFS